MQIADVCPFIPNTLKCIPSSYVTTVLLKKKSGNYYWYIWFLDPIQVLPIVQVMSF